MKIYKTEATFTAHMKINKILSSAKTLINLENQGDYKIPYRDCHQRYIGKNDIIINVR